MIDDIVYVATPFLLEYPTPVTGVISGYSLDGKNYDFTSVIISGATSGISETSYVFVS